MCSREDYEHLGFDPGRPEGDWTVLRYREDDWHPERDYPHVAFIASRGVTAVASSGSVLADPVEAIRAGVSDPPYWAVIHPSGVVNLVHGKPTLLELQRAVEGPIEGIGHNAESGMVAISVQLPRRGVIDRVFNEAAARFLGLRGGTWGPIVLIGAEGPDGDTTPLPAAVRMRLVREVIEA